MRHLLIILCCLTSFAHAGPEPYRLDTAQSEVEFSYVFEGAEKIGQMPVQSAEISIDPQNVSGSDVMVTLSAAQARAGFVFATEAMKSADVLDTSNHPVIRFQSTRIVGDLNGATVRGNLTVRGVTRPVTLSAKLYRQRGTDVTDLSKLTVLLTGSIDRRDFGAVGYPSYVGPKIGLRILARITK